jgi:hypothetical protein
MGRYVEGQDRTQSVLFPERLDDWIHEDSTVRVIDVFVDELDLRKLGFERADPAATGRPGTARRPCSRSTSTAISTGCSPAAAWRPKRSATSN